MREGGRREGSAKETSTDKGAGPKTPFVLQFLGTLKPCLDYCAQAGKPQASCNMLQTFAPRQRVFIGTRFRLLSRAKEDLLVLS